MKFHEENFPETVRRKKASGNFLTVLYVRFAHKKVSFFAIQVRIISLFFKLLLLYYMISSNNLGLPNRKGE